MRTDEPAAEPDIPAEEEKVGYCRPPRSGRFAKGHTPHNKKPAPPQSVTDSLERVLTQRREIIRKGRKVTITRGERLWQRTIDAACIGEPNAIARVVRLMCKYELLEAPHELIIFIDGPAARL